MATEHNFKVKKGLDVLGGDINLGDGFAYKIDGTTVVDSSRNLSNIGTIGATSGHTTGKFAVKYTGVHASYDFYNNGTSYLNGTTEVNAEFKISSSSSYITHFNYQDNGVNIISQANAGSTSIRNNNGTLFTLSGAGSLSVVGNVIAGNSSTSAIVRAHYNDGSYMSLEGFGLVMNRGASYIRPSTDGDKTLYIGGADASLDWASIRFRSTAGLYLNGTQFIDASRNLTNIGTISSGTITSSSDINANGYLQAYSYLYTRSDLRVLNAAGTGWNTWGSRSNGTYNLSVGTISSGAIDVDVGTTSGTLISLTRNGGTEIGRIAYSATDNVAIYGTTAAHAGINFISGAIIPMSAGSEVDNTVELGDSARNMKVVHTKSIRVAGTEVLTSARNLTNIGSLALSSSITLNNNQRIYFKNSSGSSNSSLYRAGGNATRFQYADNAFIFDAASDTDFEIRQSGDAVVFKVDVQSTVANTSVYTTGNFNAAQNIQTNGTTRITSVGNLTNIGSITASGNLQAQNATFTGNLTVSGTTTTIDTANLNVEDNNITLNYSTGDSSASANGAGITIQDAVNSTTDASMTWNATSDVFQFSHGATFGTGTIDPDSFSGTAGGFGNIADGGGWGARGVYVHGGGTGDAAAMAHNGNRLYFGIQDGSTANSMATWLDVQPNKQTTFYSQLNVSGHGNSSQWNTAYGWGNHASQPYAKTNTANTFTALQTFSGSADANWKLSASSAHASWRDLEFEATTEWGDGTTKYGVLGGINGVMLRRPHVVWSSSDNTADIRFGRSGGTSSGSWYGVGTLASNVFSIHKDNKTGAILTFNGSNTWDFKSNNIAVGGTTVIDSSRNLTNIGTISSGAITSSGDVKLNGNAKKYAAPVYRDVVTGISNSGYTTLFTVDGGGLASTIRMTLSGTANNVVVNLTADISVGHSQDILITSKSGFYTTVTLKVISNNNEDFAVQATTNHVTSVNLNCEVFPLNNELVTFTTSHSFTGSTHTHTCYYGTHTSGTGGNDGDLTVNGRTFLQDGSIAAPALTFRNDDNTGLYRVGSDSLGWVVGGSRKFYTSASRAYFQNLSEGVDVPSLRISGTTVIDSSRVVQNVTLGHSNTGARFETNDWMYDTGGKARLYFEGGGRTFFGSDAGYIFRDSSDVGRATISDYGSLNLLSGGDGRLGSTSALGVGGVTVIDSSRNLTNIGTISSGAITSTGTITASGNVQHTGLTMTSGTDIDQVYTAAQTLTITTSYADTGIDASDLATGTYLVQLQCNDHSVGGAYSMIYSGVMSWADNNTNDTAVDEIPLHRAGHASVGKNLFLRVQYTVSSDVNNLKLQIRGNYNASGSSTYTFKFRRMI